MKKQKTKKHEHLHRKTRARGFLTIAQQCVICGKCCCCLKYGAAALLELLRGFARQDGGSRAFLLFSFSVPPADLQPKPTSCRVSLQRTEPPGPTTQHTHNTRQHEPPASQRSTSAVRSVGLRPRRRHQSQRPTA